MCLYNRALSAAEIAAIFNAASAGKCPPVLVSPTITTQPANQTVTAGNTATFSVTASGTSPLRYQWVFVPANNNGQAGAYAETIGGFDYSAVVTNGSFGYGNVPNVSFVGGWWQRSFGLWHRQQGVLTGIAVTNAGSGYFSLPAVVIAAPNGYFYGQTNGTLTISNSNQNSLGNYFVVITKWQRQYHQ